MKSYLNEKADNAFVILHSRSLPSAYHIKLHICSFHQFVGGFAACDVFYETLKYESCRARLFSCCALYSLSKARCSHLIGGQSEQKNFKSSFKLMTFLKVF